MQLQHLIKYIPSNRYSAFLQESVRITETKHAIVYKGLKPRSSDLYNDVGIFEPLYFYRTQLLRFTGDGQCWIISSA